MLGTVLAKRARAAGVAQRLKRCVAMCCDALRRVAERCDAPRRVALPTVMSISPTRLIDDPNMVQSRGDFKTARCHKTCAIDDELGDQTETRRRESLRQASGRGPIAGLDVWRYRS